MRLIRVYFSKESLQYLKFFFYIFYISFLFYFIVYNCNSDNYKSELSNVTRIGTKIKSRIYYYNYLNITRQSYILLKQEENYFRISKIKKFLN